MDIDNPFDRKMESNKRLPGHVLQGLADTNDTLDFMWASVQSVFGERATPELAASLVPAALAAIEARRQREAVEWRERMEAATK